LFDMSRPGSSELVRGGGTEKLRSPIKKRFVISQRRSKTGRVGKEDYTKYATCLITAQRERRRPPPSIHTPPKMIIS